MNGWKTGRKAAAAVIALGLLAGCAARKSLEVPPPPPAVPSPPGQAAGEPPVAGPGPSGSPASAATPQRAALSSAIKAIHRHDWDTARSLLESIPPDDPDYPTALHNLGILSQQTHDFQASLNAFRLLTDLEPSNPDAWVNLGWAYHLLGNVEEAEKATEHALQLDPHNVTAMYNMGFFLIGRGRLNEAIAQYKAALAGDPRGTGVGAAMGDLEDYRASHPGNSFVYYPLALLYQVAGDTTQETEALEAIVAAGDDPAAVEGALSRLKELQAQSKPASPR